MNPRIFLLVLVVGVAVAIAVIAALMSYASRRDSGNGKELKNLRRYRKEATAAINDVEELLLGVPSPTDVLAAQDRIRQFRKNTNSEEY